MAMLLDTIPHYECTADNIIRPWMFWRTSIRVKTLTGLYPL